MIGHWAPGFAAFYTVELPASAMAPDGAQDRAELDRRIAQLGFIARRVTAGHERV